MNLIFMKTRDQRTKGRVTKGILFQLLVMVLPVSQLYSQFEALNEEWRWVHFTTESGLPSNHVYDVVETGDGTTWASTADGLAWCDGFRWHAIEDTASMW